jgi:integrase
MPMNIHDLRQTFATRVAQVGVDIYAVSKLLGHEDVSTTARHYAHHSTESLRLGVDVLDSVCYNSATVANGSLGEKAVSY